jgi:transposase
MNVLKPHLRITITTLLEAGVTQREIERRTGVDRKTIRRYAQKAKSPTLATGSLESTAQTPPPRPPGSGEVAEATEAGCVADTAVAPAPGTPSSNVSACAPHAAWIDDQLQLGRNAMSIYQDLVERHGFAHAYNSVKRFVAKRKAREPERFDVLEYPPGEEAQVDFGKGALTLRKGRYQRPWLFVMTLKYSGKSYRACVWKADQEAWARLHEQAFHAFGGCPQYAVLDNLKVGVLKPDIYEPELNPSYAALLAHYGVVADPCRIGDPNRKGTVESAVQHTQTTALKGRRFETLDEQNTWLEHWEQRWAAPRIHGRKKRQVLELFREEQASLRPLPATRFRYFRQETRTVDDAGLVQVDASYYAALPAPPHSQVTVRIYDREIEILDAAGTLLRRHEKAARKGSFILDKEDRIFNPSRETARLLSKAERIGPHTARLAQQLFARFGRPGQRALYGLTNLVRTYPKADIEAVCARMLEAHCHSYSAVRKALERTHAPAPTQPTPPTTTGDPTTRPIDDYQTFWDSHTQDQEDCHRAHVDA